MFSTRILLLQTLVVQEFYSRECIRFSSGTNIAFCKYKRGSTFFLSEINQYFQCSYTERVSYAWKCWISRFKRNEESDKFELGKNKCSGRVTRSNALTSCNYIVARQLQLRCCGGAQSVWTRGKCVAKQQLQLERDQFGIVPQGCSCIVNAVVATAILSFATMRYTSAL